MSSLSAVSASALGSQHTPLVSMLFRSSSPLRMHNLACGKVSVASLERFCEPPESLCGWPLPCCNHCQRRLKLVHVRLLCAWQRALPWDICGTIRTVVPTLVVRNLE